LLFKTIAFDLQGYNPLTAVNPAVWNFVNRPGIPIITPAGINNIRHSGAGRHPDLIKNPVVPAKAGT
jgi:hypothetical protein